MLHALKSVANRKEGPGYPISPRLLDTDRLRQWRENIANSGDATAQRTYLQLIGNNHVREKLKLIDNQGS